jgi:hypothetical protein
LTPFVPRNRTEALFFTSEFANKHDLRPSVHVIMQKVCREKLSLLIKLCHCWQTSLKFRADLAGSRRMISLTALAMGDERAISSFVLYTGTRVSLSKLNRA